MIQQETLDICEFIAENALVITSIFISVVALAVATYNAVKTRQHQRLSFTPLLMFWYDSSESDLVNNFTISNKGLGTAKIKKFEYFWAGRDIEAEDLRGKILDLQQEDEEDRFFVHITEFDEYSAVSKDEVISLVRVYFKDRKALNIESRLNRLNATDKLITKNLTASVKYESLYKDPFILNTPPKL